MAWESEHEEFTNFIQSGQTQVWLDRKQPDTLEVMAERGSGYGRESITTNIPMDLLVKLMEHAGYTVVKPT